ncbi:GCN5 family acetyltransferase [Intrasporangium chromatireducens Q5-1]|uniref:GCN5 family acetyltransferase n=1 Tax=Intrasporangium chromatireducens Q5-1 TaxID=584657 RepID=W9GRY8_9MICO|nr:GNAT family N-acetyltransferase [Intrasporangium chromatireducens]EWT06644.1 GCN5 family acetyltransferase [Intrasporangium chromatireducens Q5-1]
MPDVRIRRAGADDALIVAALHLQSGRDLGQVAEPGFLDRFADAWLAARPDHPTWIAESHGEHAGVLSARRLRPLPFPGRPEASWLYVGTVFVAPAHRKRGIGRSLIEGMLEWCRTTDVKWVRLNAETSQHAFYQALGFAVADTILEYDLREGA